MDPITGFLSSLVSSTLANLVTFFGGKNGDQTSVTQENGAGNTGINHGVVQHFHGTGAVPAATPKLKFEGLSNSEVKKKARLLFVDNQSQAYTMKLLRQLGWERVEQLEKTQIKNTDAEKYRDADLVFVDFKDIGDPNGGEGLSILKSLCEKYRGKKYYILFTAHSKKISLANIEMNSLWIHLPKGSNDHVLEAAIFNGLRRVEI
jgi:hypothetical protein